MNRQQIAEHFIFKVRGVEPIAFQQILCPSAVHLEMHARSKAVDAEQCGAKIWDVEAACNQWPGSIGRRVQFTRLNDDQGLA